MALPTQAFQVWLASAGLKPGTQALGPSLTKPAGEATSSAPGDESPHVCLSLQISTCSLLLHCPLNLGQEQCILGSRCSEPHSYLRSRQAGSGDYPLGLCSGSFIKFAPFYLFYVCVGERVPFLKYLQHSTYSINTQQIFINAYCMH